MTHTLTEQEKLARPTNAGTILRRFVPSRVRVNHELGVSTALRDGIQRESVGRAHQKTDENFTQGRSELSRVLEHRLQHFIAQSVKPVASEPK